MKNLFYWFIEILSFPFRLFSSERMSWMCHFVSDAFYCAIVRHRFKSAPHLKTFGHPFEVQGGKYIELGDSVTLGKDARLEAHEKYVWAGGVQHFTPKMVIGERAVINPLCHIGCINEVRIGKYVTIAERSLIIDHDHGDTSFESMSLHPRGRALYSKGPVIIEDYVAISENCIIVSGVTIGHHSFVGGGAVVTSSVPPYSVVAGNPARVIKTVAPK